MAVVADRRTAAWGCGNGKYDMGNPVAEDVNGLLFRAIRWFTDKASADGFRLDAVKHVPAYFFGKMDSPKDGSNWGYGGQVQEQFNISRGFSDWGNHRDTVFDNLQPRALRPEPVRQRLGPGQGADRIAAACGQQDLAVSVLRLRRLGFGLVPVIDGLNLFH